MNSQDRLRIQVQLGIVFEDEYLQYYLGGMEMYYPDEVDDSVNS